MIGFVFNLLGFAVALGLGIAIMVFGWGLHPISWGWVIWGGIASSFNGVIEGNISREIERWNRREGDGKN